MQIGESEPEEVETNARSQLLIQDSSTQWLNVPEKSKGFHKCYKKHDAALRYYFNYV